MRESHLVINPTDDTCLTRLTPWGECRERKGWMIVESARLSMTTDYCPVDTRCWLTSSRVSETEPLPWRRPETRCSLHFRRGLTLLYSLPLSWTCSSFASHQDDHELWAELGSLVCTGDRITFTLELVYRPTEGTLQLAIPGYCQDISRRPFSDYLLDFQNQKTILS